MILDYYQGVLFRKQYDLKQALEYFDRCLNLIQQRKSIGIYRILEQFVKHRFFTKKALYIT